MKKWMTLLAALGALAVPAAASAAPTITITRPVAEATYGLNENVLAAFTCAGATSCVGTFANGSPLWTGQVGYFAFKVTAKSGSQTVTKSANYHVAVGSAGCPNGYVALTYDDGPSTMTRQYVDTLVANGAKATFFTLGQNVQARPTDAQYIASHGMRIEDHTMTHPDLTSLTQAQMNQEINGQKTVVQSTTGQVETLLRPPYGYANGPTFDTADGFGLREMVWTIDTNDWAGRSTAQIVADAATAKNDDIILMHEGYATTLAAMKPILDGFKSRGLCAGKIVPSWDGPFPQAPWGLPIYVHVVAYS